MTQHWSARFVGIPWAEKGRTRFGVDCYGLVRLVYADVLGLALPSYAESYVGVAERTEIAAILDAQSMQHPWQVVPLDQEREYDVALFRRAGYAAHVGVLIGGQRMLHIDDGRLSYIEPYRGGRWGQRLIGVYRHADV